ncbi:MAG: hypothetical protein LQ346_005910 [Caloplaca aetnensis]|nr:MAG: hypothetical protein LQ346_005910 [Caloplaca aetnensis]
MKDYTSPTPSRLLRTMLLDVFGGRGKNVGGASYLIPGYHLVYFPPNTSLSSLLHDNTDPLHSPGPPFNRRMWAGGDIKFDDMIRLRAGEMKCQESIVDVEIKGNEGAERVFVTIQRYISSRKQEGSIVENRTLVFMRDEPRAADDAVIFRKGKKRTAQFYHTLTPSPALLFRFSALTFNAHRIHLDQGYCRDVEGYRNLLVHGPLSLVLMLQFLQILLTNEGQEREGKSDTITHVNYRCLAPLYAEEQLKVCIRKKSPHRWQTWIERPDGGMAVRGTVRTAPPPRPGVRREVQSAASSTGEREEPSLGTNGVSLHHTPEVDRPASSTHGAVSPEAANSGTKSESVEEISSTGEGELSADDAEVART